MEALILYFVLFFPGVSAQPPSWANAETIPFSALRELGRTLCYTIPALALLWYLITDKKGLSALRGEKPGAGDIPPFIIGFPGLLLIGVGLSFIVTLLPASGGFAPPPKVEAPANFAGYLAMIAACIGTGYLEESYFRYYLLAKCENLALGMEFRVALSTVLFSACHIYEGPWGILNAALAGVLLSVLFIRYKSLHGIAWAHGAYNIFVYVMGNFGQ